MKQLGILCLLCLLILGISTAVVAGQVVEYSMYDEFGDIMFNAPGKLTINGKQKSFKLDDALQSDQDLSKYRYRTDDSKSVYSGAQNREEDTERDVLTTYSRDRYKTNQVWKFRPLDEEKEKKIIKIEDEPVRTFKANPYYGTSPVYRSPMRTPMMSPMMSPMMTPMVPIMPGLMYPMMPYRSWY